MMKHTLFLIPLAAALAFSAPPKEKTKKKEMTMAQAAQWKETDHKFGKVAHGPEATFTFEFKNKGKKPIVITSAQPGCSCTVSEFTQTPVAKNKTGKVTAKYGTQGRPGFFKKGVTVTFQDGSTQSLTIEGDVMN